MTDKPMDVERTQKKAEWERFFAWWSKYTAEFQYSLPPASACSSEQTAAWAAWKTRAAAGESTELRAAIKAVLMDINIGAFGMYKQFAEPKVEAIIKLLAASQERSA